MPPEGSAQSVLSFTQILTSFTVSMAAYCVGFSVAYTGPALDSMVNRNCTPFEVSAEAGSWVGSIMPLAAMFGGLIGGPLLVFLGRRLTLHLGILPLIGGWILISLAKALHTVFIGRAVNGLAVGIIALAMPVLLGETVHPKVRGLLGIMPTTIGNLGMLTAFAVGWMVNWRMLAVVGGLLCAPVGLLMFLLKESPRWYLFKGRRDKALRSLTWLRRQDADVDTELKEMESVLAEDNDNQSAIRKMFRRKYVRPILVAMGLMFFQQFSGINALIFYTVTIFNEAGSTINSNLCCIIVGLVNFAGSLVATLIIDLVGRKILLYISVVSMFLMLFTLSIYSRYNEQGADTSHVGWIPLTSFVIYILGFSLGFGPIPFLMMGELSPSHIRGAAAAIIISFNWLCTFIVTKTYQNMTDKMGNFGTLAVFCIVCVVGFFFILFQVPETKGKSLEQIEQEMTK